MEKLMHAYVESNKSFSYKIRQRSNEFASYVIYFPLKVQTHYFQEYAISYLVLSINYEIFLFIYFNVRIGIFIASKTQFLQVSYCAIYNSRKNPSCLAIFSKITWHQKFSWQKRTIFIM